MLPVCRGGFGNPTRCPSLTHHSNPAIVPQFPQKTLQGGSRHARQDLNQFRERNPLDPGVRDVLQQQRLVGLAIEAAIPRVDARLPQMPIEPAGEEQAGASATADALQDALPRS